jgi:hypothetical protein
VNADPADRAAAALVDTWGHLMALHPDAWMVTRDGVAACATGIPSAGLNGVWCSGRDPDPAEIKRLLGLLTARGLPHMLQMRPSSGPAALALAEAEGMTPDEDLALMRLDDPARLEPADAAVPELAIRRLGADEAELHVHTAAAGFGHDYDHFLRLLPPPVMSAYGLRAYVGEVEGEIVTTALGVTRGQAVGVFNVATPRQHRGHGYGAGITARTVQDGLATGARWAWLQSRAESERLYEALGFETLERWLCWVRD